MWDCEYCGLEGLDIQQIYQCWQSHLSTRVIEKYLHTKDLRDGAVVCQHCYDYLMNRKLDHVRHMKHKEFIKKEEFTL
jgi:hypothetical protein